MSTNPPNDLTANQAAYAAQPIVVSRGKKRARSSWLLNLCFLLLALLTICNLNAVAANIYKLPQFLSPLILISGVVGVLVIPKPWTTKVSRATQITVGLMFAMLLIGMFGMIGNKTILAGVAESYRFLASIFVFLASALICGRVAQTMGLKWLLVASFIVCGISTASVFLGVIYPSWNEQMSNAADAGRASGFFGNPNEAGPQGCLFICLGFALTAMTGNIRWLILSLAIGVPAVFFTFSRGSIIALVMVVGSLSMIVFPVRSVFRIGLVLIAVGIAIFSMKSMLESQVKKNDSAIKKRLEKLDALLHGRIDSRTTGGRLELAKEALYEWTKSPVYGHGLGGMNRMPRAHLGPHNLFLKVLGETGALGFGCFMFALFVMGLRGLQTKDRTCRVIIIGTVLSFMLGGMTSHGGLTRRNFLFALGLAMAVDYYVTSQRKQSQATIAVQGSLLKGPV